MEGNNYNLPNVFPDGALEPIAYMDLIIAKINHEGSINNRNRRDVRGEQHK